VPEKLSVPDDGRQGVVLLVEDDPDVAAYAGLVLRRLAGARVLDAPSTDAALAVLAAEDVDVVVTDIDLVPGADGLELTALVRKRRPLLPVIVLSGHATFDHAVVAMRAGAAEFLEFYEENGPTGLCRHTLKNTGSPTRNPAAATAHGSASAPNAPVIARATTVAPPESASSFPKIAPSEMTTAVKPSVEPTPS